MLANADPKTTIDRALDNLAAIANPRIGTAVLHDEHPKVTATTREGKVVSTRVKQPGPWEVSVILPLSAEPNARPAFQGPLDSSGYNAGLFQLAGLEPSKCADLWLWYAPSAENSDQPPSVPRITSHRSG